MAILSLACGANQVLVHPGVGGAIRQFLWRGIDILRPTPLDAGVRQMGVFPLAPYSNRIGYGHLPGHAPLRPNFPGEPHSMHGFGWQRAWRVLAVDRCRARLLLEHAADEDWPFDCELTQDVELDEHALTLRLALRNTDTRAMPVGLGFHPFFPVDGDTRLDAQWDGMWERDLDHLPEHHVAATCAALRAVAGWKVDNCFTGWMGAATLDYAHHRVRIEAGPACGYLVCFRPGDGRAFIALEPVSHIPNAHQMAARGVAPTGLRELASGECFDISMTITPSEKR